MAGQPSDSDPVETIVAWIIDSRTTLTSREQRARLIEAGHDPRNIDLAEQRIQAIAATPSRVGRGWIDAQRAYGEAPALDTVARPAVRGTRPTAN